MEGLVLGLLIVAIALMLASIVLIVAYLLTKKDGFYWAAGISDIIGLFLVCLSIFLQLIFKVD